MSEVLTIEEAAKILRIAELTLYRLCAKKKFPAFKVGRVWRIQKCRLEQWMEGDLQSRTQGENHD